MSTRQRKQQDKAPEWEHAWHIQETARRPAWLECSEPGGVWGDEIRDIGRPTHSL